MGFDQGQYFVQLIPFTIDRIDERLPLIGLQAGLQGIREGRIDAQGDVCDFTYGIDGLFQDLRFVYPGDAHIYIQYVSPFLHLLEGLRLYQLEISLLQGPGQLFSAGGVDTFPDDYERVTGTDKNCFCGAAYGRLHRTYSFPKPEEMRGATGRRDFTVDFPIFFCGSKGCLDVFIRCAIGQPNRINGKIV